LEVNRKFGRKEETMKQVKNNRLFLSTWLLYGILPMCLLVCFCSDSQGQKGRDVEAIAREVSQGVGVVGKSSQGTRGAPILVMEEQHNSRAGQIQHAITLVRLHDRYGLKHIALEGYLKERPDIKTNWFFDAADGDSVARARVAVRLLMEGEISSAEFMKLVYDDVFLHPVETAAEYTVEMDEEAGIAPILYLLKIAEQSLREEHIPKLKQLQEEIEAFKREDNKEAIKKKNTELFDYILSADPWAQSKAEVLQDLDSSRAMPGEQHLALIEEIENRAKELSVEFEPDEKKAMEHYLAFWRARIAGSKTMVLSAGEIADLQDVSIVAMTVGAAHTEGMCAMLNSAGRPFAVVTPLSLKNHENKGDFPWDMLQRKYKRLSIYSDGFMDMLLKAFPSPDQKKPEPVLPEPWAQGKAELYLFTDRITRGILGPSNPPGGGEPPYGFPEDAFRGKWVLVDPRRISIIPDTEDGKERAVLFPAILNPNDPARRTEIWVKAGLGVAIVPRQERESVESMLMKALQEVQSEVEPSKKVEDTAGRVQITLNTVAGYARSQHAATRVVLGAI
jgi:hypothetical protein